MELPQLTEEERRKNLEKAAAARHERAVLREALKKGEKTVQDVFDDPAPAASKMKVSMLIESLPGYGKAKVQKIMEEVGIAPNRRVGGLGARQREELLKRLG